MKQQLADRENRADTRRSILAEARRLYARERPRGLSWPRALAGQLIHRKQEGRHPETPPFPPIPRPPGT